MLPMAVAWSSSGDVAICHVMPVLWVTSRWHIMARNRRCEKGIHSKVTQQGQHRFDAAAYTQTDPPEEHRTGDGV